VASENWRWRWGLIPFDTRDFPKAERDTLILARADKLGALHSWREPAKKRRCLVPTSAFYEWPEAGRSPKQPYVFEMGSGEMFAFAGIWDAWKDERGHWLQSFAIVTAGANELMARIHSGMPVILHPRDYDRWLDRGEVAQPPIELMRPYEADAMEMREANPAVNNVRNNGPEMLTKPDAAYPTDMTLEF
jgi:putative SOS response-associated peptidase YedK